MASMRERRQERRDKRDRDDEGKGPLGLEKLSPRPAHNNYPRPGDLVRKQLDRR